MGDLDFLQRAIELSEKSLSEAPGGPFGAVIVKDGQIVAEGWNEVTSANDPTAHAEVQAIRKAGKLLNNFNLKGTKLYTSCEPCPMCLAAIYWARIDAVIFANTRLEAAEIGFDDAYIYDQLAVQTDNRDLNCIHLPQVRAKAVFDAWSKKRDKTNY